MPATILASCRRLFLCCALAACGSPISRATAAPRIPPLNIAIAPASATIPPGASVVLTAHASGGEAIRLIIEWSIEEGENGGQLELLSERGNGEATARYTAPAARGIYHVRVQLHGFPAVAASATINVDAADLVLQSPAAYRKRTN